MPIDNLSQVLTHLGTQFEKARPILLTGAGFSKAAKNVLGQHLPTATELKTAIWPLCFGEEPFEDSSTLQELYQIARARHEKALVELVIKSFTVQSHSLPEWYSELLGFPWHRCYTLNIDDLADAAQRRFKLKRRLITISATSARSAGQLDVSPKDALEFIHLNGTLSDLPDRVTFSLGQYADRLAGDDPWYHRFVTDLLSRPVVFIGTQLDEPPMWQHIERRRSKGGRAESELRPRSYLVIPSLSKSRQACLSQFNITLLPASAQDFFVQVIKPLGGAASTGHQLLKDIHSRQPDRSAKLSEVADLATNPNQQNEFLMGAEPIWADIQSRRAITRESDSHVWDAVQLALNSPDNKGYVLITGPAGTGKSTALKRIALRLAASSVHVGWVDRFSDIAPRLIRDGMLGKDAPSVLAIDDADIYGSALSPLINEVCSFDQHPLVLVAVRSGKVDRALNPAQLGRTPSKEVVIPSLTDSDIDGLIDVLDRENRLNKLIGKPRAEQHKIFREKCGRQLLVAMIEATSGEPFEKKIYDELSELEPEGQQVYALVAVASSFRFTLTKSEILLALGDPTNKVMNAVKRLVSRHLISEKGPDVYQARHRVVADVIVSSLASGGQLAEVVRGLARAAASEISDDMPSWARPRKLLQFLINHDFLKRTLGLEEARNLYGDLEDLLRDDYSYWLQRGSLEVEAENVKFAEMCLNHARGLNPDDHNTQTEYAYLLFLRALAAPRAPGAVDSVEEAKKLLLANIALRGSSDPHSYHVYGNNMLKWILAGIPVREEQKAEMNELMKLIKEGNEKHPKNQHLKVLCAELETARIRLVIVAGPAT